MVPASTTTKSPADQFFPAIIAIHNLPGLPLPDLPSIEDQSDPEPPIRIMALHAMLCCERLFYLEEVKEIYVADANVYAGRRLHDDIVPEDDISPEKRSFQLSNEDCGLYTYTDHSPVRPTLSSEPFIDAERR